MALETKIEAKIVAGVDRGSFNKAEKVARDTGKKINQDLKVKMELDIAAAQIKLKQLRKQLTAKDLTTAQRLKIQVDTNRAQRNVTELKRRLNNLVNTGEVGVSRLQAKFNNLGKGIASSFKSMFGAAAAVGALMGAMRGLYNEFTAAATASRKFETAMSNVSTLVDTSVESMDDMGKAVLEIAKNSPKSVEELTSALYDIRSAGVSASDAMDVLDQSAKLAVAGLGTTKEAADLMTGALNNFGKQGYSAEQIASTFFLAVKDGKTTIAELSQGFGGLSAKASSLGVDFKELVAGATALTTGSISASEAYTQLNAIITAVTKATPKSQKAAKDLQIEFNAVALETQGLKGFVDGLNDALKRNGLEGGAAAAKLNELFGRSEALSGILSLLNTRSEAYNGILEEMRGKTTALTDAYDKQAATVEARIARLNNELEVQRIQLGDTTSMWQGFGTYLKIQFLDILNKIGKVIGVIADVFVGSFKIIYQSAKGALTGIKDGIVNLFKTGKFEFNFDFGAAAKEAKSLASKLSGAFDGSTKETAIAVKQRNDIYKKANEELKKIEGDKNNDISKMNTKQLAEIDKNIGKYNKLKQEIEDLGGTYDDLDVNMLKNKDTAEQLFNDMNGYKDALKDFGQELGGVYDDLTKKIKASQDAQKALNDEINGIDTDIAGRVAEINKELEELSAKSNKSAEDFKKINDLNAEKKIAYEGMTDEEKQALKDQVDEITEYEKLTEIEKLQLLKEEKQKALDEEIAQEEDLTKRKEAIQNNFSEFIKGKIEQEIALAEKLRQKWLAVAAARASGGSTEYRAAGGPITAGSPYIVGERGPELIIPQTNGQVIPNHKLTINQNVNANVSNGVDIDNLANQLARKITLAGKGIL